MSRSHASLLCTLAGLAVGLITGLGGTTLFAPPPSGDVTVLPLGGFSAEESVVVPVGPEEAFDLFTGDVKPWWDHTMSGDPLKLEIDPFPGGAFREVFDEAGNGVEHARVIGAKRGEMLRMDGPLGFAGTPLHTVYTLLFEGTDDGRTTVTVEIRGAGHVEDGWGEVIAQVWRHFLVEQFEPYVQARVADR